MLIERADFADLASLAAHRQRSWERQRDYLAACSKLHRRAWAGAVPPLRLEALSELPLIETTKTDTSTVIDEKAVAPAPSPVFAKAPCPRTSMKRNTFRNQPVGTRISFLQRCHA